MPPSPSTPGTAISSTRSSCGCEPAAFGDEAFRQWRDSFDQGACAAGGGVIGNAEATLGGRQTFIASCVGGMHTYHVYLE